MLGKFPSLYIYLYIYIYIYIYIGQGHLQFSKPNMHHSSIKTLSFLWFILSTLLYLNIVFFFLVIWSVLVYRSVMRYAWTITTNSFNTFHYLIMN